MGSFWLFTVCFLPSCFSFDWTSSLSSFDDDGGGGHGGWNECGFTMNPQKNFLGVDDPSFTRLQSSNKQRKREREREGRGFSTQQSLITTAWGWLHESCCAIPLYLGLYLLFNTFKPSFFLTTLNLHFFPFHHPFNTFMMQDITNSDTN